MTAITTRAGKGSPLTNAEVDSNFTNLDSDKFEKSGGTITGATVVSVSSAEAALRITQVGTGNALVVEDSANPDATPLLVSNDGVLTVGTASSTNDYRVDIAPQAAGAALRIRGGSGGASFLQFADSNVVAQWGFLETNSTSHNINHNQIVRISTASTERLRINSSGNVGIGTATPTEKLDVVGNIKASGTVTATTFVGALTGNADTSTTATNLSGGTINATTGTFSGDVYTSAAIIEAGRGNGSVALTCNDGHGNANVAFNHRYGTPDVTGSSARIQTNVDSATAGMSFMLANSTTSGVAVGLASILTLSTTAATFTVPLSITGALTASSLAGGIATGTGASGTWGISVSGNAATATTATNLSGGSINATTGDFSGLIRAVGGTLQVGSSAGVYRQFRYDGTMSSDGTTFSAILNAANYSSYSPTLTGGGASGTWGINITGNAGGNAATATALQTARSINGVSFNGTANITIRGFTGTGNDYNTAGMEVVGNGATVFPSVGFHQPGAFAASIQLRGGTDFRLYAQGASSYANLSLSSLIASNAVTSGANQGFRNDVYYVNARNPIWSFGNAGSYGVSYLQGSSGRDGIDNIALHPNGDPSAGGASFTITTAGNAYATASFRAPIFYDSNDTGYYADPNSTSRFNYVVPNKIKLVGSVNNEPRWDFSAYVMEAQHWYGNNSSMTMYLGESNYINIRNIADVHGDVRTSAYYNRSNTGWYYNYNDSHRFGTTSGYIDIGPKNSGTCHIYSDRPSFYFNQPLLYVGRRVLNEDEWINGKYFGSDGLIYAHAFYDANDGSWYCNPAGESRLVAIKFSPNNWNTSTDGYNRLYFENSAGTYIRGASGSWYIQMGSTSTTTSIIEGNGNFYTTGAVTAYWSDKRLKKNIKRIDDWREILRKSNGYRFEWNDLGLKMMGESAEEEKGVKVGILAQDAKEALPQAAVIQMMQYENKVDGVLIPKEGINYDPEDPYLTVQMEKYIPVLIEASKGLMEENDELKSVVAELLVRISALENQGN